MLAYLSDDDGRTWRRSEPLAEPVKTDGGKLVMLQEPGVIELNDGRLLMFIRTYAGVQYYSYSEDGGETWRAPFPSDITSPRSPASIERIPGTGDLLLLWNDNGIDSSWTPFNVAISRDEGRTWEGRNVLEDDPNGWYCYTTVTFIEDRVLLGHVAGDRVKGKLSSTQITSFDVDWLYD